MLILCQPTLITYGLCTRFFGTNISPNVLQLHIYLGNCNSQEVINFLPSLFLKTSSQYQLHISPPLELYMYFNNSPLSAWNCTSGILFLWSSQKSKHQCILISLPKPGKYIGNAILTKPGWNCTWASSFSVSCSCWRNWILWCQLLGILGVQYLRYSLPGSICFQIQHLKTVYYFCSHPIDVSHFSGGGPSSNHRGGSNPDPPRGLQRQRRQVVKTVPFTTPYFL